MHNIEHKPAQEELASTSEQKGATMTERQKPSRAWRYAIIGGSALLVFAVIIAGLLTFANQKENSSSRLVPTPTIGASTIPTTLARETTLPAPVATPIPALIPPGHNISVTTTIATYPYQHRIATWYMSLHKMEYLPYQATTEPYFGTSPRKIPAPNHLWRSKGSSIIVHL